MKKKVGIIVGRFQCPYIHDGYKELMLEVSVRHTRVIIFVGQSPLKFEKNDPYDYSIRKAMLEQMVYNFEIHKLNDFGDVELWSKELDKRIAGLMGGNETPVLYGSRDRFKYTGKYPVVDIPAHLEISATQIREECGKEVHNTEDFRRGINYVTQTDYVKVQPTVDIAPYSFRTNEVLLVKKPRERYYRFVGGRADVRSDSYEADALRELEEETSLIGKNLEYMGSTRIEDWRYRGRENKVKTLFFAVTKWSGVPLLMDDLEGGDYMWKNLAELETDDAMIMPEHRVLVTMLLNWVDKVNFHANKSIG